MKRRLRRVAFLAAAAFVGLAGACSSFGAGPVDAPDAGPSDAAVVVEASADVGTSDVDAGADAGPFCDRYPDAYHCFDFDGVATHGIIGFTRTSTTDGGFVAVSDGGALVAPPSPSPPFALSALVARSNANAQVYLDNVALENGQSSAVLELDVLLPSTPLGAVLLAQINEDSRVLCLYLNHDPGNFHARLSEVDITRAAHTDTPLATPIVTGWTGAWLHVRFELRQSEQKIYVTTNGGTPDVIPLKYGWNGTMLSFGLGLAQTSSLDSPWEVLLDDIVVQTK